MMDVALVNDGPVGVDYHCEDSAVKSLLPTCQFLQLINVLTGDIGTRHQSSSHGHTYLRRRFWNETILF
jgi:D-aminoacyl-tRNA deacylase